MDDLSDRLSRARRRDEFAMTARSSTSEDRRPAPTGRSATSRRNRLALTPDEPPQVVPERPVSPEEWDAALHQVLVRPELIAVVAQPLVDFRRGAIVGHEVLSRFTALEGVGVSRWFAEAAARGLADELEARAFDAMLNARDLLSPDLLLAINVGAARLADPAIRIAVLSRPTLEGLVLELTRAPLPGNAKSVLAEYRRAGAAIAVDGAAGRAGLTDLLDLRPDILKLDRRLIAGIDTDLDRQQAVRSIARLAQRSQAYLVAGGIERRQEQEALLELGVSLGQGFLYGQPQAPWPTVDPSAFAALPSDQSDPADPAD